MATGESGPAVGLQVDPSARVERDPFGFQECALNRFEGAAPASSADFSARVHDSMPRDVVLVGERRHGVPHLPGSTGQTGDRRDGPVRRNAPFRYLPDDGVESFVGGHATERGAHHAAVQYPPIPTPL